MALFWQNYTVCWLECRFPLLCFGCTITFYVFSSPPSAVNDGKCHTSDGQVLEVGQEYSPDNDPCHTCECKEGNQLLCRMVACAPELACGGRGYTKIPGTCCQFTCDGEPTRVQGRHKSTSLHNMIITRDFWINKTKTTTLNHVIMANSNFILRGQCCC